MKDKASELKQDAEWNRYWRANPNGNVINGVKLRDAKEIHGLLTIAIADGREDLIGWLAEIDDDNQWNDAAYLKLWQYYTVDCGSNMPLVQGISASGVSQGPYTLDRWHKRVISCFPNEQVAAFMVMERSEKMRDLAQCLLGIFPKT